jgi:hypothetical protein
MALRVGGHGPRHVDQHGQVQLRLGRRQARLLELRISDKCGSSIGDLGEEHGHRVLKVRGKGGKVVLSRCRRQWLVIDLAIDGRESGSPILRNSLGDRMDRHAANRRLKHLAEVAELGHSIGVGEVGTCRLLPTGRHRRARQRRSRTTLRD